MTQIWNDENPVTVITGKANPIGVKINSISINNPPANKRNDKNTVNLLGGVHAIIKRHFSISKFCCY